MYFSSTILLFIFQSFLCALSTQFMTNDLQQCKSEALHYEESEFLMFLYVKAVSQDKVDPINE